MNLAEWARSEGVHPQTAYRWFREGTLPVPAVDSDNNIIAALSAQIARLKSQHRAETTALREALAKAHGENLDLRRELHRLGVTKPTAV